MTDDIPSTSTRNVDNPVKGLGVDVGYSEDFAVLAGAKATWPPTPCSPDFNG